MPRKSSKKRYRSLPAGENLLHQIRITPWRRWQEAKKMEPCPGMDQPQAAQRRRDILSAIYKGTYIEDTGQTVAQYLDFWLKEVKNQLVPYTWHAYESHVRIHLIPTFGKKKLTDLKPVAIQQFYNKLVDENKLSAKTVKNIHGVLHAALNRAEELLLINRNPAKAARPPKATRVERKILAEEDFGRFIEDCSKSPYWIPILIILSTGTRKSEALALTWEDFIEKRDLLIVSKSLSQDTWPCICKGNKDRQEPRYPNSSQRNRSANCPQKKTAARGDLQTGWLDLRPGRR